MANNLQSENRKVAQVFSHHVKSGRRTCFVSLTCHRQCRNKNPSRSFESNNPRHPLSLGVKEALILLHTGPVRPPFSRIRSPLVFTVLHYALYAVHLCAVGP